MTRARPQRPKWPSCRSEVDSPTHCCRRLLLRVLLVTRRVQVLPQQGELKLIAVRGLDQPGRNRFTDFIPLVLRIADDTRSSNFAQDFGQSRLYRFGPVFASISDRRFIGNIAKAFDGLVDDATCSLPCHCPIVAR